MKTELVTDAFRTIYPYSFWWMIVPVIVGIVLFICGLKKTERTSGEVLMICGAMLAIFGSLLVFAGAVSFRDDVDEQLLQSDISEHLKIESVDFGPKLISYIATDWHVGKGPDGEFVEFALIRDEESSNKFVVVYK